MASRPLDLLLSYIDEDCPSGDVTSDAVIPGILCTAAIRSENEGIIAGLEEARMLFSHFGVTISSCRKDGDAVRKGELLISLSGNARAILLVERTALNVIGRMSGIATQTKKWSDLVATVNPKCRVAATRKTCPGFRMFDKKAVVIGGGDPHRFSLSDGVLIKDNHLVLVPPRDAIRLAKAATLYKKIEVETESVESAREAALAGADIIMLDNMTPAEVKETLNILSREGLRENLVIEISGGVDERTLEEYAALDIDRISMGALTHTVKNFSVTLEILP